MTDRLADVEARIATVGKLSGVISAMRGLAGVRAQEARRHGDSIRLFAATIGEAIGRAIALLPDHTDTPAIRVGADGAAGDGSFVILLTAEQGFAGSFSERIFEAAAPLLENKTEVAICGDRGRLVAEERGLAYARFAPMISHPTQATALAERLTRTIFEALAHARVRQVFVVHATSAAGGQIDTVTRRLLPFDFGRFPEIRDDHPPLVTLPVDRLLEQLAEDYIFADLTLAIMQSMAAENEARMRAMIAAHENVTETMAELVAVSRRLRQDQITEEIVELAVGSQAAEHGRKRSCKAPIQAGSP